MKRLDRGSGVVGEAEGVEALEQLPVAVLESASYSACLESKYA